jgi:hypothetical protein
MTGWQRITFHNEERPEFLIHVLQAGEVLSLTGLMDGGRSIWACHADHVPLARARGAQPEHALTLERGVIEIYFAPGTYERLAHRLTTLPAEPCTPPKQADVTLLVGNEPECLRHWA